MALLDLIQNQKTKLYPGVAFWGTLSRIVKYLFVRALTISVTIFIGVFITVVLANQSGQIDASVKQEISAKLNQQFGNQFGIAFLTPAEQTQMEKTQDALEQASGLREPYWVRQAIWTFKALRLDWPGTVDVKVPPRSLYPSLHVTDIILTDLPHTLLLVGTAYLLLFLLGLPLALYLFHHQGGRLDRLITLLAPISSVPSWVLCVLFILIFAVNLRILPPGGMYDVIGPANLLDRIFMIFRHMILPVLAMLASLLFQYAYIWRTFFLLYADEDYVELAKAKGLSKEIIERQYIIRPTLPYIITNFALMLVSFWQMTIALEKIINWPGIGRLYLVTLPDFFGERFNPGSTPITLGIVVIFAYLLGITVLVLDIFYALLDPRVRIGNEEQTDAPISKAQGFRLPWAKTSTLGRMGEQRRVPQPRVPARARETLAERIQALKRGLDGARSVFRELVRYPSAVFGLSVILILSAGSLYAVTAFPYNRLAELWSTQAVNGKTLSPKLALPEWVNWFQADKLPSTVVMNSQSGGVVKTVQLGQDETKKISITYEINYPYTSFPQNIVVYFSPKYTVKRPFVSVNWITPDGREFEVGRISPTSSGYFDVANDIRPMKILPQYPAWRKWFVVDGNYPTPGVDLLFADPHAETALALPGVYKLRLDATTFEKGADLDAQFVLLGKVYGAAGTDIMGRDLLVPLLWGMPFALVFGLLGACVTTFLSMIMAATGVWFGGWVDTFIERLVEANMILPIIAIGVLIYSYFNVSIWIFLTIVVLLNVFASPTKSFRAAFIQVKNSPYLEAARAYGASDTRIIFHYLVPRIVPVLIPQLVTLIPSYVFLEATLGIFNVKSDYPTWGKIIYEALRHGANYGSNFWVLEPLGLLLLTGLAFAMLGFALERILNPKIRES